MIRLILFAALVAIIAFAIRVLAQLIRAVTLEGEEKDQEMIPAKLQRVTYLLLILLMLGVTTGWLGAA